MVPPWHQRSDSALALVGGRSPFLCLGKYDSDPQARLYGPWLKVGIRIWSALTPHSNLPTSPTFIWPNWGFIPLHLLLEPNLNHPRTSLFPISLRNPFLCKVSDLGRYSKVPMIGPYSDQRSNHSLSSTLSNGGSAQTSISWRLANTHSDTELKQ